jgi:hypothetical protein
MDRRQSISIQESSQDRPEVGPILVSIPHTFRLGAPGIVIGSSLYCSPTVRVSNSTDQLVDELVLGLEYRSRNGQKISTSTVRVVQLKSGATETRLFIRVPVSDCDEVGSGTVEVVRCAYLNGKSCQDRVRAVSYGAIPLIARTP